MNTNIEFNPFCEYCLNVANAEMRLLLGAAVDDIDKKWTKMKHTHFHIEVVICNEDDVTVEYENASDNLNAGDIILIPEGVSHQIKTMNFENYAFGVTFKRLPKKHNIDVFSAVSRLYSIKQPIILHLGKEKCEELTKLTVYDSNYCPEYGAFEIFGFFLKLSSNLYDTPMCAIKNISESYGSILLNRIEQMVGDRCVERITNEEMANRLNISKRHLSEIVLRRYGMSLQQLFAQKRLEMAGELLRTTDLSVALICEKIGWSSNLSTFYTAFKKKYGISPGEYREK